MLPFVSVLVINLNGRHHLEPCFASLLAQDYPADRFEVVLVDNGSTDGSVELTRERFPWVRVFALERNHGFAGAYHRSIAFARGDFLLFLNNDTRVEPDWLSEMVRAADEHTAAVVASKMVDWDGRHVDFGGGIVSAIGHAWQVDQGKPAATHALEPRPVLFGCGGSVMVERGAYERVGGFDTDYFIYFEDVDLGWRLSLFGYRSVLAPRAITYHRLHGTVTNWAATLKLRLYERNALYTIYKNYEDGNLRRILPAAIGLTIARALRYSSLDPAQFRFGSLLPASIPLSPQTIATLIAIEEFGRNLPLFQRKRESVQSQRVVDDASLWPLFVEPLKVHAFGEPYESIAAEMYRLFGIDELIGGDTGGARPPGGGARLQSCENESDTPGPSAELTFGPTRPADQVPLVSVVILTATGPRHLPDCLASLARLDYPADRLEIVVVDNGSPEDPSEAIRRAAPGAKVVRLGSNTGFCGGNQAGAAAASGEWLFFLNDDTRVAPDCLRKLLETAGRRAAVCVGARILDWEGRRIDFAGGGVNFEGKGFQIGFGEEAAGHYRDEVPVLFACGAAMLVRRDIFLDTGGFDPAFFAYYEDLAFGWQLWIRGHEIWLSPDAVVYHRHHGTSDIWGAVPRARLCERNALFTVTTHLEGATLDRALPAALVLAVERALLFGGLADESPTLPEGGPLKRMAARAAPAMVRGHLRGVLSSLGARRAYGVTGNLRKLGPAGVFLTLKSTLGFILKERPAPPSRRAVYLIERGIWPTDMPVEPLPPAAGAILLALDEWLRALGRLRDQRAALQSARRRSDAEILSTFGRHWTHEMPMPYAGYSALHRTLVDTFRVELFNAESTELAE